MRIGIKLTYRKQTEIESMQTRDRSNANQYTTENAERYRGLNRVASRRNIVSRVGMMISDSIKTISLVAIAACYLANTVAIFRADTGGHNICMGNFCYHIEEAAQ